MLLYKYMPPHRLPVLLDRLLRFTPPGCLNDPFEMRPVISGFGDSDVLARRIEETRPAFLERFYNSLPKPTREAMPLAQFKTKAESVWPHLIGNLQEFADQKIGDAWQVTMRGFDAAVGVLCLAEPNDSILMWSHYADGHTGFALGFDSTHAFFNRKLSPPTEWGRLWPVSYSVARPVIRFMDLNMKSFLLTKSDAWSYEREQRMFLRLSTADHVAFSGLRLIHLFRFPCDMLKEVVLGARFPTAQIDVIRTLLMNNREYSHVRLLKEQPNAERYTIDIVPVAI